MQIYNIQTLLSRVWGKKFNIERPLYDKILRFIVVKYC